MEGILGRIVAIVLGLIALAGVGYAAYNGFQNSKGSDVTSGIAQLVTNARAQFSQSANLYTNFTTANLTKIISAGIIPQNMTNGTTTGNDPWGNALAFAPAGTNNSQGVITFGGGGSETVQECVSVAQNLKDYISLKVGTTTFTPQAQPDPTTAAAACTAAATTFVLTFQ